MEKLKKKDKEAWIRKAQAFNKRIVANVGKKAILHGFFIEKLEAISKQPASGLGYFVVDIPYIGMKPAYQPRATDHNNQPITEQSGMVIGSAWDITRYDLLGMGHDEISTSDSELLACLLSKKWKKSRTIKQRITNKEHRIKETQEHRNICKLLPAITF